jgi:SnoaL-like domain
MNQIDSDEWEIHKLLNRYTDAVNQRDWDTYQACWTEDAVWELHTPINITKTGIDNILTEARRAVESQELFVGGMFILAYYTDDLVKQGGIWKFKQRVYDVVYIDTTTPGGDVFPLHKPSI